METEANCPDGAGSDGGYQQSIPALASICKLQVSATFPCISLDSVGFLHYSCVHTTEKSHAFFCAVPY